MPADQMIEACNNILALKVFAGEKLAGVYFWSAVGWNKKGNTNQVIADASEAIKFKPDVAIYNLRGSAYYDKGEYDIAIADFNDALRLGPPSGIVFRSAPTPRQRSAQFLPACRCPNQMNVRGMLT